MREFIYQREPGQQAQVLARHETQRWIRDPASGRLSHFRFHFLFVVPTATAGEKPLVHDPCRIKNAADQGWEVIRGLLVEDNGHKFL